MNRNSLIQQLKIYEKEYKVFMDIQEFPKYDLSTKKASLYLANTQGFDSVATTSYQPKIKKHSLHISTNLSIEKYVLFHEFTHMLDSEIYANGDSIRYAGISGFTEYHASQVELLQLLGVDRVNEKISFSMNTIITTIAGEKSVYQYVKEKQQHAIELFSRTDFPADLNTLKSAFGVLYNYYGLRSICEMYAVDYTEEIANEAFLKSIPTQQFVVMNRLMHGYLSNEQIELCMKVYLEIIFPLIKEYNLA